MMTVGRWQRLGLRLVAAGVVACCPFGLAVGKEPAVFISEQQLTTEPKHVRLAFHPERPTRLLDVPSTFWTVQLVAVSSKQALEDYARAHHLAGMSAARIAHDGELRYALLLGVYETREIAEEATTDLPAPLDQLGVWVRSLKSLQKAIIEGDHLAGGSDF